MATCYRKQNQGSIAAFGGLNLCSNFTSDNGYSPCCFTGSTCLENGLCYTSNPASGSAGYYEALCSDPTFSDSSCSKKCTAYTKGDTVYDSIAGTWKCCGADSNGSPNCMNPTNVTFSAPNPSVLLAHASGSSTTTAISKSTSTSTGATSIANVATTSSASTSSPSPSASAAASQGLGTGATVGIGVGIALAVVAVGGAIFWFLLAKKRRQGYRRPDGPKTEAYHDYQPPPSAYYEKPVPLKEQVTPTSPYMTATYAAEMPANEVRYARPDNKGRKTVVHELSG